MKHRVYQTKTEKGETSYVYLLDSEMQMEKIGLISTNQAEQIIRTVTETPYRSTAEIITNKRNYRWLYHDYGNAKSSKEFDSSKGTKMRWKRFRLCGCNQSPGSVVRSNVNCLEESIQTLAKIVV